MQTTRWNVAVSASTDQALRMFLGHCCKVSDEAAFCLIQRPYISKTLLT
ncbi:ribbon-helix-helix domain-containing protein, partial [Klebsiella pneumoniae]